MEIGINLAIQNMKESLINAINDSKLPPGIVQLALCDILTEVRIANVQAIESEKIQFEQIKEKEGVEDGKEIHKD